jgi:hypothetical protein
MDTRVDDLYALLRRTGEVSVPTEDKATLSGLRNRAKRDGLNTSQHTERGYAKRYGVHSRTSVNLVDPARPDYIVRPDAGQEA